MRNIYLICYDIADDWRRSRVFKVLRGFGDHIQFSVFRCELSPRERVELIAAVSPLINQDADRVLLVDVGPSDGRGAVAFQALGLTFLSPQRYAVVL